MASARSDASAGGRVRLARTTYSVQGHSCASTRDDGAAASPVLAPGPGCHPGPREPDRKETSRFHAIYFARMVHPFVWIWRWIQGIRTRSVHKSWCLTRDRRRTSSIGRIRHPFDGNGDMTATSRAILHIAASRQDNAVGIPPRPADESPQALVWCRKNPIDAVLRTPPESVLRPILGSNCS